MLSSLPAKRPDDGMSKNLARIMNDLFAKPSDDKEFSTRAHRLGYEIRKVVLNDETMVGKFRDLLASFESIIPDERQRYQAALQALSTTSKLDRKQILEAVSVQLEQLKALEKETMPANTASHDAMKSLAARSGKIKSEIAQLRDKLAKLETEERTILASMATQEQDLARVERTVKALFTGIAAEIGALCRKMEGLTAEDSTVEADAKPAPPEPVKSEAPGAGKQAAPPEPVSTQPDTPFRRACPMCGGPLNLLEFEKTWQCYICAYEEPSEG